MRFFAIKNLSNLTSFFQEFLVAAQKLAIQSVWIAAYVYASESGYLSSDSNLL
jgi:hypothetical protein